MGTGVERERHTPRRSQRSFGRCVRRRYPTPHRHRQGGHRPRSLGSGHRALAPSRPHAPRACYRCGPLRREEPVMPSSKLSRPSAALVLAALAAVAAAQTPGVPAAVEQAAHSYLTRAALEAPIRLLSSDLLEGRGPAGRGDLLTRLYLQTQPEGLGYVPAFAAGNWQQPFDIVGIKSQLPASWSFQTRTQRIDLAWSRDYIATSGVQSESVALEDAELVFVGYGIQAPEYRWDDFKGAHLAGKVLLMMNNDPDWDPKLVAGKRRLYYGRWDYKYASAARQQAVGAVILHTTPSAAYPWQVVQSSWGGEQFQLPAPGEARGPPEAWPTEEAPAPLPTP